VLLLGGAVAGAAEDGAEPGGITRAMWRVDLGKAYSNMPESPFVFLAIPAFRNIPGILGTFSEIWVLLGIFATVLAFQAFIIQVFSGTKLGFCANVSGNYVPHRHNAQEFGCGMAGNYKGIFGQAIALGTGECAAQPALQTPRMSCAAAVLPRGRVVCAGGRGGRSQSAEIWEPAPLGSGLRTSTFGSN
jgi:hypothetical protein